MLTDFVSNEFIGSDNWNQMFLTSLFKGPTARQRGTPPSRVLDLGCGSGLWVLEAAKCWPVIVKNSGSFVGVLTSGCFLEIHLRRHGLPSNSA